MSSLTGLKFCAMPFPCKSSQYYVSLGKLNSRFHVSTIMLTPHDSGRSRNLVNLYLYNTNSVCLCVCVCVCLSSIGGQTAGPIMTKFGTHMRIDLGIVPTINWPHEWPGSMGSLGPISESGLSCQLLLRAVVWQMTSQ